MTQTVSHPSEPTSGKMTYEEFLARMDEDTHAEWVDGEVIPMTVSAEHNDLGSWLIALFRIFLSVTSAGKVFYEPFQMKTGPDLPGRSPDVFFVATENLGRVRDNYLEGPADLVIEIVSPDSQERDRGTKFVEYERGGVREYWVLDPIRRQAEFYRRGADGYFHAVPIGEGSTYRSVAVSGLWVQPEWFWQDPLPSVLDIIRQWEMV